MASKAPGRNYRAPKHGSSASILALAVALVGTSAQAGPTAADRETARTLLEQGRELSDRGDLKEALKRFKAADDIMHVPTTALRVAKAQAALGLLVEARDTLAAIQRTPPTRNEPQPFNDARREGDRLDAALAPRIPSLTITVSGAAAGEEPHLTLDGVDLPAAVLGLPRVVDPGHHVIVADTPTGAGTLEVDVKEAEQKRAELALVTKLTATATATATVDEPPENAPPAKRSHAPTLVTWTGVGVAGAGVIVGTITGVMAISKKSTLQKECPNDVCGTGSDLGSATTLATVSDIAFATAGVGAVVAIVTLALGHKESARPPEPATGRRVTPWLAFDRGGMGGLRGTF